MKVFLVLAVALLGAARSAPLSGQCTEDCVSYLLTDLSGPKVLRLYKELLKPNLGGLTSPVEVNGQTYEVSPMKKNLIENAIRKGVKETLIEAMLDDGGIVPSSIGGSSSSRVQQQQHHHQQTVEPVSQRRPVHEPLTTQTRYKIVTKSNGDVNIEVKGQTLKVPDDLYKLPQIVTDPEMLEDIIKQLQDFGVPIKREGNRVTVSSPTSPQGLTLRVSIKKIDDKPSGVTITANDEKYVLPEDEYRLNRYLAREPEVAYHILRILSSHGVPVEFDAATKTLKTQLTPEDKIINSRTSLTQTGNRSPSSTSPEIVRIGDSSYYLPEDWDRLKKDIQEGKVSARAALETLDTKKLAAPSDVYSVIRTRITTSASQIRVMRRGDDVTIEIGGQQYKLPNDVRGLEKALKENDFPIELIRDSLLRIGIDSRRIGSNLRVVIPGGDAYLMGLPSTKQYEYKLISTPGGLQINAGSDSYVLPADKTRLEAAIADKRILPRTLVDALNDVGYAAKMDFDKQELTVDLTSGTVRLAVPLSYGTHKVGSRLRLNVRGPESNKVYTLTVGEGDADKIELPSEVHILNNYIRSGKIDSSLLLQLLSRMGVSHYYDSVKDYNIVTLNGRPYEINQSATSEKGSSHRQEVIY